MKFSELRHVLTMALMRAPACLVTLVRGDPHNDRAEHLGMPGWHQSMTDTYILILSSSYHPDRNIS